MEDVFVRKTKRIKGFIDQNGLFIKATSAEFEGLEVEEVIAESICFAVEKCSISTFKMEEELKNIGIASIKNIFSTYLIEHYGYLYVELLNENGNFELIDVIHAQDIERISKEQRARLFSLCNISKDKIEENQKLLFLK